MALTNAKFTLGTASATKIATASINPQHVTLHNMSKSGNEFIHIGGVSSITTTNSIHIDPGETLQLMLLPNEELYAIAATGTPPIGVLLHTQGT